MEIKYNSYARPYHFEIDNDEIKDCKTFEEAMRFIEHETSIDFEKKLSWYFSNYNKIKKNVEKLLNEKEK